jgi:hypothetical protein
MRDIPSEAKAGAAGEKNVTPSKDQARPPTLQKPIPESLLPTLISGLPVPTANMTPLDFPPPAAAASETSPSIASLPQGSQPSPEEAATEPEQDQHGTDRDKNMPELLYKGDLKDEYGLEEDDSCAAAGKGVPSQSTKHLSAL